MTGAYSKVVEIEKDWTVRAESLQPAKFTDIYEVVFARNSLVTPRYKYCCPLLRYITLKGDLLRRGGSVILYLDRCLSCLLVIHSERSCGDLDIAIWRSAVLQS